MSIILPTSKVKASQVNPKRMVIYSKPKAGKSSAFSGLENVFEAMVFAPGKAPYPMT